MFNAFMDVKYHGLSMHRAAKERGVCEKTLQRRMRNPFPQPHRGSNQLFSGFDEDILVEMLRKFN
jgi:hypothetical protein